MTRDELSGLEARFYDAPRDGRCVVAQLTRTIRLLKGQQIRMRADCAILRDKLAGDSRGYRRKADVEAGFASLDLINIDRYNILYLVNIFLNITVLNGGQNEGSSLKILTKGNLTVPRLLNV